MQTDHQESQRQHLVHAGNVTPDITEGDLRDAFAGCGELTKVKKVESRSCAFVTFAQRDEAEAAAEKLLNTLIVRGARLRLMWGKPQAGLEGPAPQVRSLFLPNCLLCLSIEILL